MQAHPQALIRTGFSLGEYRSVIEVQEFFHLEAHGCSAGMVEQEEAGFEFLEIDLVADHLQPGIIDELLAGGPDLFAGRTGFEFCSLPGHIFLN